MKVLVLGGTRFAGVHLVRRLIEQGHEVTIATRGNIKDGFNDSVVRKIIDRRNEQSLKSAFFGESYDVVVDNICYSSNDVRHLLDNVCASRYVLTSSASVYDNCHLNLSEDEVDTQRHELKWCNYEDFDYAEVKRQAEAATFQHYDHLPSVAVRFPWIFGTDDYTKRLYYYIECIANGTPMYIDNLDEQLAFISSHDAGNFLAWCAQGNIQGAVNAASEGTVNLRSIIEYAQNSLGKQAILSSTAQPAPLSGSPSFSMKLDKAKAKGYCFEQISDWLYPTLDFWLAELKG